MNHEHSTGVRTCHNNIDQDLPPLSSWYHMGMYGRQKSCCTVSLISFLYADSSRQSFFNFVIIVKQKWDVLTDSQKLKLAVEHFHKILYLSDSKVVQQTQLFFMESKSSLTLFVRMVLWEFLCHPSFLSRISFSYLYREEKWVAQKFCIVTPDTMVRLWNHTTMTGTSIFSSLKSMTTPSGTTGCTEIGMLACTLQELTWCSYFSVSI